MSHHTVQNRALISPHINFWGTDHTPNNRMVSWGARLVWRLRHMQPLTWSSVRANLLWLSSIKSPMSLECYVCHKMPNNIKRLDNSTVYSKSQIWSSGSVLSTPPSLTDISEPALMLLLLAECFLPLRTQLAFLTTFLGLLCSPALWRPW